MIQRIIVALFVILITNSILAITIEYHVIPSGYYALLAVEDIAFLCWAFFGHD
jgi:hypothetical protein